MAGNDKIIRDPIHGFIKLTAAELELIEHPAFQRLRRIRQLALTDMIYPGACHSRFEHSLGVLQVATLMFDQIGPQLLSDEVTDPKFSKEDLDQARVIVRLAALLHDVGHAPFSHAGEDVMPVNEDTGKRYKHEDYSLAIISRLFSPLIDHHSKDRFGVTGAHVCSLLKKSALPAQLLFWKDVISGQMDADRADYLLRDSHHAGVAYGRYDLQRLVATLRVVRDPDSDALIPGVEKGGIQAVEGLILARYMMFLQVYFHHARRAYDRHVTKTLKFLLQEAYGNEFGEAGVFPPPTSDENVREYLRWTDTRVWEAIDREEAGPDGQRIKQRRHNRSVHETSPFPRTADLDTLYAKVLPALHEFGAYVDNADNSWYKFERSADIRIATAEQGVDSKPVPLSSRSELVKALKEVTQRRVYVPFEHKEAARHTLAEAGLA
jgi:uncharacterized protein